MNFDYLEEAQDQRNGLIQYDPTVPLPAFYDPPDEREELFYPPRNPSHPRLYPLLTIQTHSPSEYQSLEPNQIFTVHEIPKNEVVREIMVKAVCFPYLVSPELNQSINRNAGLLKITPLNLNYLVYPLNAKQYF